MTTTTRMRMIVWKWSFLTANMSENSQLWVRWLTAKWISCHLSTAKEVVELRKLFQKKGVVMKTSLQDIRSIVVKPMVAGTRFCKQSYLHLCLFCKTGKILISPVWYLVKMSMKLLIGIQIFITICKRHLGVWRGNMPRLGMTSFNCWTLALSWTLSRQTLTTCKSQCHMCSTWNVTCAISPAEGAGKHISKQMFSIIGIHWRFP